MVVKLSDISSKTAKKCIFCVFRLFLSLFGTILVKPHQCRLHQSILPTQGPIHEIFMEKYWKLAELDNEAVLSRSFLLLFFIYLFKFFFCFISMETSSLFIFLQYGGFLQNPGKNFTRTYMNTTVLLFYVIIIEQTSFVQSKWICNMFLKGVERTSGRPFERNFHSTFLSPLAINLDCSIIAWGGGFKRRKEK